MRGTDIKGVYADVLKNMGIDGDRANAHWNPCYYDINRPKWDMKNKRRGPDYYTCSVCGAGAYTKARCCRACNATFKDYDDPGVSFF